jgi:hypothetical protein
MSKKITATFWLFIGFFVLFYLILSKLFFNNPAYPESNLILTIANSLIMSLFIVSAFLYSANHAKSKQTPTPSSQVIDLGVVIGEIVYQSGTLTEKDGLPRGYTIVYENSWQKPVINTLDSKDIKSIIGTTKWTTIEFGNSTIIIVSEENASNPHLYQAKDNFKILVKYQDETKISFGY